MAAGGASVHTLHELRSGHAERFGQPSDILDAGVPRAALNVADVGAVEIGLLGQNFLRELPGFTSFSDVLTEGCKDRITLWHDR